MEENQGKNKKGGKLRKKEKVGARENEKYKVLLSELLKRLNCASLRGRMIIYIGASNTPTQRQGLG